MSYSLPSYLDGLQVQVTKAVGRGWHVGHMPDAEWVIVLQEVTHEVWYLFSRAEIEDDLPAQFLVPRLKAIIERRPYLEPEGVYPKPRWLDEASSAGDA